MLGKVPWEYKKSLGRRLVSSRPQDVVTEAVNAWEEMTQLRVEAGLACPSVCD